ncbi:MAG: hypothetical protein EB059_08045 [Alphaproteobacteria bacterium]|nr:hypothetical protein [Alphaproteobacteria bacterium]
MHTHKIEFGFQDIANRIKHNPGELIILEFAFSAKAVLEISQTSANTDARYNAHTALPPDQLLFAAFGSMTSALKAHRTVDYTFTAIADESTRYITLVHKSNGLITPVQFEKISCKGRPEQLAQHFFAVSLTMFPPQDSEKSLTLSSPELPNQPINAKIVFEPRL